MWSQPVQDLIESGPVLAPTGTLPDQGGVGGKDHALAHATVPLATDLPIVKLKRGVQWYLKLKGGYNGSVQGSCGCLVVVWITNLVQ